MGAQGVNDVIGNTLRLMEQKAATLSKSKACLALLTHPLHNRLVLWPPPNPYPKSYLRPRLR